MTDEQLLKYIDRQMDLVLSIGDREYLVRLTYAQDLAKKRGLDSQPNHAAGLCEAVDNYFSK